MDSNMYLNEISKVFLAMAASRISDQSPTAASERPRKSVSQCHWLITFILSFPPFPFYCHQLLLLRMFPGISNLMFYFHVCRERAWIATDIQISVIPVNTKRPSVQSVAWFWKWLGLRFLTCFKIFYFQIIVGSHILVRNSREILRTFCPGTPSGNIFQHHSTAGPWIMLFSSKSFHYNIDEMP